MKTIMKTAMKLKKLAILITFGKIFPNTTFPAKNVDQSKLYENVIDFTDMLVTIYLHSETSVTNIISLQ